MVLASSGTHSDNDTLVTSAKSLVTNGIERLLPDHPVAESDRCGTIHKGHQVLRWRLASAAVIISVSCFLMWADFKMGEETGRAGLILTPIAVLVAMAGANEVRTLSNPRVTNCDHFVRKWKRLCDLDGMRPSILA